MKQIILGTAGHIDHGKTSLIKAVSGTDTDRLKEEKRRGITIELGFAAIDLPSGLHIGVVDVPGHEKFVKNMVAGATGIDVVAVIIAADEGVMPQTREHMEICSLLGIRYGFVVLTKTDMVDEEWLELVTEDVTDFMADTFLEDSPIVPVSSVTRDGLDQFIETLDRYCMALPERTATGIFRLPIDRVFSMKGFGTVVTGTLVSGHVELGEQVMVYPSGITTKVRGIQVHDRSVESAEAGLRTAINFQGVDKYAVNRGDVLARPDTLIPTYMIDVELHLLESNERPLKNRQRVRFHIGTSQMPCHIVLIDRDVLEPGETALVQVRLEGPVVCVRDDRYVIRSYSPVRTLGGGRVLNPAPPKHKRFRKESMERIERLCDTDPQSLIASHIEMAGFAERSFAELKVLTSLSDKALDASLKKLLSDRTIIQTERSQRRFVHQSVFETFRKDVTELLSAYHKRHPLKAGMSKGELRSKLPDIETPRLFNQMLHLLLKTNEVVQNDDSVHLAGHQVTLETDQSDLKEKILGIYAEKGLQPPYFKELVQMLETDPAKAKNVLMHLVDEGRVIRVKEELFFHAGAISDLKARLIDFLQQNQEINPGAFKEMTGASRKYTIPLFEYFDSENITIRVGDVRKLRKKATAR
ncbi:selenocysteine-specific elongation factor [Desulfosalsimonas propionicica]|uniref:Selenocysteine-specific elongation factor n=1 Tax=Desulfosalsimonas propionicica TaxID=332175 RepID=A0A7W0CCA7_9BACT|nr:selenocysteine-specific translation elongation factor [Desulfosalsimonas propionicica]MBA2883081.1 selenocysteine-specific elongation factor [Desulfosalsimonas propionicica]